uniref:Uncharacterized protein n=1 Tax=Meloidogyne enterolobii TaxID=390850 RepID=A0A6V7TT02_MELEN|nr:unnamed protein product [Meloidogyne enterolobii]
MSKPGNFAQQQQPTFDETPAQPENVELKLASTGNFDLSQAYGNDRRTQSGKFTLAQLRATEGICPLQNGTNQFDSQKLMTGFGTPRDVKGKHLKRIWELEFPEEAADYQPPPVNAAPQQFQQQPFSPTQQQQPQHNNSSNVLDSHNNNLLNNTTTSRSATTTTTTTIPTTPSCTTNHHKKVQLLLPQTFVKKK